jgi:D-inositol-3-phosphate glycosyltransferase
LYEDDNLSKDAMIRVAMLSYHTCPLATLGGKDTGGMNVYVRDLVRQLGQEGVHVDVFTRSQDEHVPHVLHELGYGNRVVHVPAGPETPLSRDDLPVYLPDFVRGIQQFASQKSIVYDLIHSHYWLSGLAGLALKEQWHIPLVHMFHTLGEMKNRVAVAPTELEGEARLQAERRIIVEADRIVAATKAEETQLQFLYHTDPGKMIIIPPGVDPSRFYPIPRDEARAVVGVPEDARLVLFVGRIEPLKGVDTLLRAMGLLHEQRVLQECVCYLVIIGGDPDVPAEDMTAEMSRLQHLSQDLGLSEVVIFLGKRDQDTLPYYYSSAETVVMPSHYESFGMVALEAMACGVPVVASQVGGLAFLVQDGATGFHVPNGDAQALASALLRLIKDPDLRRRMGEQSEAYAQGFTWEKIARRIQAMYRDMIRQ